MTRHIIVVPIIMLLTGLGSNTIQKSDTLFLNYLNGNATQYIYDANGNMIPKTDQDGYVTEFNYDPMDLIEQINYTGCKEAQFAYNANGELNSHDGLERHAVNFALDALSRIREVNDHNEKITGYNYDAVGNQTTIAYPDGTAAARK